MIEQTQNYTTHRRESSARGEMFRAVVLVREATQLLKSKATNLPHCAPGTRLQKIATGLGDFSNSLERAAAALERGHHRKAAATLTAELNPPNDSGMSLPQLEAELTRKLRLIPIGSKQSRELYACREWVRELVASAPLEHTAAGAA